MTDDLVDLRTRLEAKTARLQAKAREDRDLPRAFGRHLHCQAILADAIERMREICSDAEVAKTLRFAVDVLEARDG
jgi:hypothetical protein